MQPFSPHGSFFCSLEKVEKRLASESGSIPAAPHEIPPSQQHPPIIHSSSVPLSSPLYLDHPQPLGDLQDSSGPPPEFLSSSPQIPSPLIQQQGPPDAKDDGEIERLIDLLGLSAESGGGGGSTCDCSGGGFYSKIAGVKGPKCDREMRRLDGWIEHYYRGGVERRKEPARLAHQLLAKAACCYGVGEDGEIGFPSTVEEFLEHDPPPPQMKASSGCT